MSYGFKVIIEGELACFTRPEFKMERVSYGVPTPGALEGLLKSVYWKPAFCYVIDKILILNPINYAIVRRNEIKDKTLYRAVKSQMAEKGGDPCIYADESRTQRSSVLLKDVRYGVEFHLERTGIREEKEEKNCGKHCSILRRRLQKGQYFRTPCLGCSEFPVRKIELVDSWEGISPDPAILNLGDQDLGYMSYRVQFKDQGRPVNDNWEKPEFSDEAETRYYHPHMIFGVIDVRKYREEAYAH